MNNRTIKLLAIDDISDNLVVLKALLNEDFPNSVLLTAQSGEKGLEICQAEKPDIILLDIVMPDMDGYEVCSLLKSNPTLNHIPVVMLTAERTDKGSRIKSLEAGADGFLSKPVDRSEFVAQIRAMIRLKEAEDYRIHEKENLEKLVQERTQALENELTERKQAEKELQLSFKKLEYSKLASLSLMEDLKIEVEERREIEKELKSSENRLENAMAAGKISWWELILPSGRVKFNARKAEMLGYLPSHFTHYGDFTKLLHPEDYEKAMQAMRDYEQGRVSAYVVEYRIRNKEGEYVWLRDVGKISNYNENEKIITGIVIDISEQKLSEKRLYEKDMKLVKLSSQLEGMMYQFLKKSDGNYCVPFSTEKIRQIFGCSPQDVLEDFNPLIKVIIPEDFDQMISLIEYSAAHLSAWQYEYRVQLPGQDIKWLHSQAFPEKLPDDSIIWHGYIHDITERKMAEQAMCISEEKFRSIFKNNSAAMAILEKDLTISMVNDAYCEMTGFSAEEIAGLEWIRQIPENEHERLGNFTTKMLSHPRDLNDKYEFSFYHKNGDIKYGLFSISYIENLGKIITSFIDITKRKQAEDDLASLNEKLEQIVNTRTEQLKIANKELEAFAYTVSHDLRAPLRAIEGFTRILNDEHGNEMNEDARKLCNTIVKNTRNMDQLIDDLLAFSMLGRANINKTMVNFGNVIEKVYSDLVYVHNKGKIKFSMDPMPVVSADYSLIRQVWTNLIANAIKFSSKKPDPEISISYTENNIEFVFLIEDNGAGFDMKYAGNLFGVFQRLHSNNDFEGTGVGLAIVQRIIQRHGGSIRAEAEINKGAKFYFSIPKIKNSQPEQVE